MEMRPRVYGSLAANIWLKSGRKAALDFIDSECAAQFKRLVWTHTKNFYLSRSKREGKWER